MDRTFYLCGKILQVNDSISRYNSLYQLFVHESEHVATEFMLRYSAYGSTSCCLRFAEDEGKNMIFRTIRGIALDKVLREANIHDITFDVFTEQYYNLSALWGSVCYSMREHYKSLERRIKENDSTILSKTTIEVPSFTASLAKIDADVKDINSQIDSWKKKRNAKVEELKKKSESENMFKSRTEKLANAFRDWVKGDVVVKDIDSNISRLENRIKSLLHSKKENAEQLEQANKDIERLKAENSALRTEQDKLYESRRTDIKKEISGAVFGLLSSLWTALERKGVVKTEDVPFLNKSNIIKAESFIAEMSVISREKVQTLLPDVILLSPYNLDLYARAVEILGDPDGELAAIADYFGVRKQSGEKQAKTLFAELKNKISESPKSAEEAISQFTARANIFYDTKEKREKVLREFLGDIKDTELEAIFAELKDKFTVSKSLISNVGTLDSLKRVKESMLNAQGEFISRAEIYCGSRNESKKVLDGFLKKLGTNEFKNLFKKLEAELHKSSEMSKAIGKELIEISYILGLSAHETASMVESIIASYDKVSKRWLYGGIFCIVVTLIFLTEDIRAALFYGVIGGVCFAIKSMREGRKVNILENIGFSSLLKK